MPRRHKVLTLFNFLMLAVLVFIPVASLLAFSFSSSSGSDQSGDLVGTRQLVILGRTLLLAVCSAGLAVVIGILAGYAVSVQARGLQRVLAFAMAVPLLIPSFIHALCWILLANRIGCAVNGFGMSALVLALSFWPVAGWLAWCGFVHSQGPLVEAASFRQGRLGAFLRIRLGLVAPHLLSAFLLIALFCLADYGVPSLYRVNTYPVVVFSQFAAFYSLRGAMLSSWPYIVLPMLAVLLWREIIRPGLHESESGHSEEPGFTGETGRGWVLVFVTAWSLSALVPVLVLVCSAGGPDTYAAAWRTASPQLLTSMLMALAAGTGAGLLAFPLALGILRSSGFLKWIQEFGLLFTVALPGTILGIALIQLWNQPLTRGIYQTPWIMILLYMGRFLPFAVWVQSSGLSQVREDLLDAGRLAPGSQFNRLRRIMLPLSLPYIILGGAVVFILSLHELCGTMLISPPGIETLAVRIYSLYHYGAGSLVAAISLFLVMGAMGMAVLAAGAYQWLKKY